MSDTNNSRLFDDWPDRYDTWFQAPVGQLVKHYESELLLELLQPQACETILDAGYGTGIFTRDILASTPHMVGLEISHPMLARACHNLNGYDFVPVNGDMLSLPFTDEFFDKTVSMTALEYITDGQRAVSELFRVTRRGGTIVVTTLNSLSPWAERRRHKAENGHHLLKKMVFRSPQELDALAPVRGVVKTAIHFQKSDTPDSAEKIELKGQRQNLSTGAFLAACWIKP